MTLRILVIDDEPDDALLLARQLRKSGLDFSSRSVQTVDELRPALAEEWDVLLTDFRLAGATAVDVLGAAGALAPEVPVIVVSGVIDEDDAGAVFRAGARDFISKQRLERLRPAIEREVVAAQERRSAIALAGQLGAREAQLAAVLSRTEGGLWIVDCDLVVASAAGRIFATLGFDATAAVGRSLGDMDGLPPSVSAAHRQALSGRAVSFEEEVRGRLLSFRVEPTRSTSGAVDGAVGYAHEITESRALQRQAGEMAVVVESLADGILLADSAHDVRPLNSAAARIFGLDPADIHAERLSRMLTAEGAMLLTDAGSRAAAGERVPPVEVSAVRGDGESVEIEVSFAPVAEAGTLLSGMVIVVRDVTERKRLEEELRHAQKLEAFSQLARGIAHDLNNILLAVRGYASLLRAELDGTPVAADLVQIEDGAMRASALVARVHAFSRQGSGRPEHVDLATAIDRLLPLLRSLGGPSVRVEAVVDPSCPAVEIDPTQLDQILVNLVVNARDAMPGGGSVSIEAGPAAADASTPVGTRIQVADSGPGIPVELRDRIWDPLYTTKAHTGGSGIGLAVVSRAVREAGGTIVVGDAPGGGALFDILLPPATETVRPSEARQASVRPASGRVLVVDDDEVTRGLIGRLLGRLGYDVVSAPSGEAALALLDEAPELDYVVADLTMAGVGGLDIALDVRRRRPATGIVIVSGFPDAVSLQDLPAGTRFLQKPFALGDLAAALDAVTGGAG